ncbi:MAG: hypothetical protein IJM80_07320 [Firmicutes bacterium]|nr:hypothetical protein [Bacillota bacterium]
MNGTERTDNAAIILDYLRGAKELEWDRYTIDQLGERLRRKISDCTAQLRDAQGRIDGIKKRNAFLQEQIDGYKAGSFARSSYKISPEITGAGCLVSIFIWGIITAVCIWIGESKGIKALLLPLYLEQSFARMFGKFFGVLAHFVAFPIIVYILLDLLLELFRRARYNRKEDAEEAGFLKKEKQREEAAKQGWQKEIDDNRKQIPELEAKVRELETAVLPDLNEELSRNTEASGAASKALADYYGAGVLHPKYQGLVPVTTIFEYFETGRCSALSGHEGAYNLYESEYRLNMINARLDTIQKQLAHISAQNASIQSAISGMNQRVNSLMGSVDECLERNTAAAAAIGSGQAALQQSSQLKDFYAASAESSLRHLDRMASLEYYSRHLF